MLDGVLAIILGQLDFLVLDGAAGIRDVYRAIDQGSNTGAGATAANGNNNRGIDSLVSFGPGLGHIDQGVGPLVLDYLALFAPTAGRNQGCACQ